jgi:hypothetical protein
MNIAILIGVSQYKTEAPLPACAADVEQIHRLLIATKKYDDVCCLTTHTNSAPLKEAVRAFFLKYQSVQGIGEAFVYFSGHGIYHTDALFCCSDFDSNRPATTSISNVELDDLLRSISPDVAIKVIDACQSGSPYIKDVSAGFEKALRTSQLKSFICMASSRQDQSSYATAEASAFTTKLIDSALYKQEGTVLYRDIQAALADAFVGNPEQTPFFVSQGTGLEAFATVTEEMRKLNNERSRLITETSNDTKGDVLASVISRLDGSYVSSEEASGAVKKAGEELDREALSDHLLVRFYRKSASFGNTIAMLPRINKVAAFAHEQGWNKNYFVQINYRRVRIKVPRDISSVGALALLARRVEEEYVTQIENRPDKLESTQPLPFEVAEVRFEPKNHPSLKSFVLYIGIVHSLTEIVVLSAIVQLRNEGWSDKTPELSEVQWRYQNYPWREVVSDPKLLWKEPVLRGEETIKIYLESLAPKTEELQLESMVSEKKDAIDSRKTD